mmetsp:Transcript_41663/g.82214  ORF Transcript_41663/g.82214 Transcript_41663/m.82214 type:complete len:119 (-) Transcript_41663:1319-1675(-)
MGKNAGKWKRRKTGNEGSTTRTHSQGRETVCRLAGSKKGRKVILFGQYWKPSTCIHPSTNRQGQSHHLHFLSKRRHIPKQKQATSRLSHSPSHPDKKDTVRENTSPPKWKERRNNMKS